MIVHAYWEPNVMAWQLGEHPVQVGLVSGIDDASHVRSLLGYLYSSGVRGVAYVPEREIPGYDGLFDLAQRCGIELRKLLWHHPVQRELRELARARKREIYLAKELLLSGKGSGNMDLQFLDKERRVDGDLAELPLKWLAFLSVVTSVEDHMLKVDLPFTALHQTLGDDRLVMSWPVSMGPEGLERVIRERVGVHVGDVAEQLIDLLPGVLRDHCYGGKERYLSSAVLELSYHVRW